MPHDDGVPKKSYMRIQTFYRSWQYTYIFHFILFDFIVKKEIKLNLNCYVINVHIKRWGENIEADLNNNQKTAKSLE